MRALLSAALLLLPAFASAGGCNEFRYEETVISFPATAPLVGDYLAVDHCQPECVMSVWLYFETNGIDGLQRADEMRDETCGGLIVADTPGMLL